MAKKQQSTYVDFELEWLENKSRELKAYVDKRPLDELSDRIAWRDTKSGGTIPVVVATIEQQRSDLSKAVKDYGEIIKIVNEVREKESLKLEKRGGGKIAGILNSGDEDDD